MNVHRNISNRTNRRRAAIMVQTVIFGGLVGVGVAALAVDVGLLASTRSELQRSVDAAALAGASGLMNQQVQVRAEEYAFHNRVANSDLNPNDLVIQTGMWSGRYMQFTPVPAAGDANGVLPNAVRVVGTRSSLGLLFARALGIAETTVTRPATALVGSGQCAGIWGIDIAATAGSIITDSYDSTAGPYGPGNIRPNGDVCSCGDITANGSISIRGDAMYGEGHGFLPNGDSYDVQGVIGEHACDLPDLGVEWAYFEANNDNANIPNTSGNRNPLSGNNVLTITGQDVLTLPPGTYFFTEARIVGQGSIVVTGPTNIYISGEAHLGGGGLVNATQDPANLTLYIEGPSGTLTGDSGFYGSIIAPTATLTMHGNFNGYGTVLAQVLDIRGNMVWHVDEHLVRELYGIEPVVPVLVE